MPLILWCTVRADKRGAKWVAQGAVMETLLEVWSGGEHKWLVGDFMLMPDHLHFFCCPKLIREGVEVERWTGYWKDRFTKRVRQPQWRWQDGLFHTRMRSDAHYLDRLDYMRENPVKAELAAKAEDWPWQGRVWDLSEHIRSFGEPEKGNENAPEAD
jgi:REP element-mobilizing transposase RayT